jgi:3-hydroxyacyl-CoA dehydrogenase/enoyl-CoA hydratase/3-hydroxybutyryl-CoA epimerase
MPLVEIILGKKTSEDTLARALDYVGQLRKTPIVVNDNRGFYTSRCFGTFLYEGMQNARGRSDTRVDRKLRAHGGHAGRPAGGGGRGDDRPAMESHPPSGAGPGKRFQRPVSYDVVRRFVEELKRPGRRFGAGFYDYPAGGRKRLWPGLASVYPPAAEQPDAAEVWMRLLHIQALEAARCMEEGVVTTAAEADLGSILGWGFRRGAAARCPISIRSACANSSPTATGSRKRHGRRFKPSRWLRARAAAGEAFHAAPMSPAA